MIDVPASISDNIFDRKLKRGTVIRTQYRFPDGSKRNKYLIVLNYNVGGPTIIFVFTTSQTEFYKKYPQFNPDILALQAGTVPFFAKETVIDCRQVYKLSRDRLKENFQDGLLQFAGELSPSHLAKVDQIIRKSRFISPDDKKYILGEL
ncbi:MAG: type II toxin-antitoxin system PemK/MazF family toxin [Candidatus Omnitrophica bacterium]|nr:type II toxin-antitoxin system PemK/MazF family toxin [Candidatus Omnitrophota bacterium]